MCMVLNKFKDLFLKTAQEDIIVYKILGSTRSGDLQTPYRDHRYSMDTPYETHITRSIKDVGDRYTTMLRIVSEKGFHSFSTLSSAKQQIHRIRYTARNPYRLGIYECVVPKGSKYLTGCWSVHYSDGVRVPNIVSNQLIIKRKVADYSKGYLDEVDLQKEEEMEQAIDDIIKHLDKKIKQANVTNGGSNVSGS